ncbi:MAG: hypothetical protein HC834_00005, partial [Rhodospirillales bacterium]|nr:hypothetical protein [Rhodospirillales bacterium]
MLRVSFKWLVALCIVGAAGVYSYQMGKRLASTELNRQRETIAALNTQITDLETVNAAQRAQIETAEATGRNWQSLYERDIAIGATKSLFELIQRKTSEGVEIGRLTAVVNAMQPRRACRREAERRGFLVPVRQQDVRRSPLKFAAGKLTL